MMRASFFTFFYTGHRMTVDLTFALLTILSLLFVPMGWLPMYIGHVIEFAVSVERLEKFFS